MIRSLHVQNFQSHKDSHLEFEPGVNVIIGPSDCGKTALFRALNWVVNNRPTGTAFRSRWGGETRVEVELDEGLHVIRTRGKSLNQYALIAPQEDGEPLEVTFKAVGTAVPNEIAVAFNLNDINVQSQLDAPFLLSDSPGEVGKRLQAVANLEAIGISFSKIAMMIRTETSRGKLLKENIQQLQTDLVQFEGLDAMSGELEVLEGKQKYIGVVQTEQSDIHRLGKKIIASRQKVERFQSVLVHDDELKRLEALDKELEAHEGITESLSKAIERIERKQQARERWEKKLHAAQADFKELMPDVCPLCQQEVPK